MTEPHDFTVECHPVTGGRLVVDVTGDLDYASYLRLENELAAAIGEGPATLIVDLAAVTYCDSVGLRVLLGAAQSQRASGGEFELRAVSGQPQRALRLTGLDTVLSPGATVPSTDGPAVQA